MDVDVGKNVIDKLIFFSGQTVCSVRTKINLESRTINLLMSDFIRYKSTYLPRTPVHFGAFTNKVKEFNYGKELWYHTKH